MELSGSHAYSSAFTGKRIALPLRTGLLIPSRMGRQQQAQTPQLPVLRLEHLFKGAHVFRRNSILFGGYHLHSIPGTSDAARQSYRIDCWL